MPLNLLTGRAETLAGDCLCTARPVDPPERRRSSMQSGENGWKLLAWRRFEWYQSRNRFTRHLQLDQQESLNLCEALSSSREGMMRKNPRKHVLWSLRRSGMRFLMKPLSLKSGCQRANWGKCSMSADHLSGKRFLRLKKRA